METQTINYEVLGQDIPRSEQFYRLIKLIREFELTLLDLFSKDLLSGTTHTSIGQEANAVGILSALNRDIDMVWSNHRCHGHFLSYCGQTRRLFAEILGKSTGVCSGRGGSQHLHWRNFSSSGIQGGFLAAAVGAAVAEKSTGAIGCAFLGDGTMGEGTVYEALNLASLSSAPLLFVVEDNAIAQTTPKKVGVSGSITDRAAPFGIPTHHYRGTDVDEIADIAKQVMSEIRESGRPAWLHIETVRLGPHSKGDDTRDAEEIAAAQALDPLKLYRDKVANAKEIDAWCEAHLAEMLDQAMKDEPACA
ncbi:MAG: thiamine pyrophosphate-dependent dehydrogenase E1 component subunit alpha [Stappiaceae bacterium]